MWRSFTCPITLTAVEPVEPDQVTAQRLRLWFGPRRLRVHRDDRRRLDFVEQRWLLYAAEGTVPPDFMFTAAPDVPGAGFVFAGPLDQVVLRSEFEPAPAVFLGDEVGEVAARMRLVDAEGGWRTMRVLDGLLQVEGSPTAARYVSLVADRFDDRGWRVERVAGARCTSEPLRLIGRSPLIAVEFTPRDGLWWWGDVPSESPMRGLEGTLVARSWVRGGGDPGGD